MYIWNVRKFVYHTVLEPVAELNLTWCKMFVAVDIHRYSDISLPQIH